MIKVYGCSDDLVEIEGNYEDEIGCCKPGLGVWWIKVEKQGTAKQTLTICEDEDAEIYSDIFEIDSPILGWEILKKEGGGEDG